MTHSTTQFNWVDPFQLDSQLTADERQVKDATAAYCQDRLKACIDDSPFAFEDFINGRFHIVVNAAVRNAAKRGKR